MKRWAFVAELVLAALAGAAEPKPVFVADGQQYRFDTGALRGTLRVQGKSQGLTELMDTASGVAVSRFMGCVSHYRLLDADARYGEAAWDWTSTARLLTDGSVEARWPADGAGHRGQSSAACLDGIPRLGPFDARAETGTSGLGPGNG